VMVGYSGNRLSAVAWKKRRHASSCPLPSSLGGGLPTKKAGTAAWQLLLDGPIPEDEITWMGELRLQGGTYGSPPLCRHRRWMQIASCRHRSPGRLDPRGVRHLAQRWSSSSNTADSTAEYTTCPDSKPWALAINVFMKSQWLPSSKHVAGASLHSKSSLPVTRRRSKGVRRPLTARSSRCRCQAQTHPG